MGIIGLLRLNECVIAMIVFNGHSNVFQQSEEYCNEQFTGYYITIQFFVRCLEIQIYNVSLDIFYRVLYVKQGKTIDRSIDDIARIFLRIIVCKDLKRRTRFTKHILRYVAVEHLCERGKLRKP